MKEKLSQVEVLDKDLVEVESVSKSLSEEIENLEKAKEEELEKSNAFKEEIQELEEELVRLNRNLDSKSNEQTLLKSMIENLEVFQNR